MVGLSEEEADDTQMCSLEIHSKRKEIFKKKNSTSNWEKIIYFGSVIELCVHKTSRRQVD